VDEYSDRVRFVIKFYPYRYRHFAHIAAEAALSARDQGRFWEMHEKLLENSPTLDRQSLIGYARELGLDMELFIGDLDSMKHRPVMDRDTGLAVELDLYNTPSFFFNGRKVLGNRPYENLKSILEEELDAVRR
jgi:protein-disulfide isomerase